ncbi:non-homologous end-joining DNA ligase [Dongia soli]|uniref:non-homologous end-joining DNA ligase n=1 Tax=Dongia soli TaxID=600628 RepID=UPI003623FA21
MDSGKARLFTRNGYDWSERFPALIKELGLLPLERAYIDGELCAPDERGASDFGALQESIGAGRDEALIFYVFDLLILNSKDLRRLPLTERRAKLTTLINGRRRKEWPHIQMSEAIEGDAAVFFRHACKHKLEGIISKKAGSRYVSGRTLNWVKVKCSPRQEFIIGGYIPSTTGRGVGSLLLGHYHGGFLVYDGRAGTGFTHKLSVELEQVLKPLTVEKPILQKVPREHAKRAVWIEPELVCEVQFTARSAEGYLRQASFKGLRQDIRPKDVTEAPVALVS